MSSYKTRARDKGNINNDYVKATRSGTTIVNGSSLSASNLQAGLPVKTDNALILQSTKLEISDTNGLQTALDSGVLYQGTLPAPVGALVKISDTTGNVENSNITEADVNNKVSKSGDTMTGNLNLGSNDIDSVNNIEAVSLDGLTIMSGTNTQDLDLNNIGFNVRIPNCNLDMDNNNILNCDNIQLNSISATTTDININNRLLVNSNDIFDVDTLEINKLGKNGAGDISIQSDIDVNNFDLKFVSNIDAVNLQVSSINNLTPVGGIYSGISDGATISSSTFTDLLPTTSVGGLSVPGNGFLLGSAFHLVCAGIFPSESKNDNVEIELCAIQGATTIQLGVVNLDLENFDTAPSNFELESDFVIRSLGVAGQVAVSFDFTFNKKLTKDFKGTRATSLATIDTTQNSTLALNARIIGSSGSSIKSTLAYLRKQF